ncbi:immunoglobulin-like domain-containing protein [Brevibacillus choshinensis]|uniref:immunoglobulin-like domain-containing protein n=1 Tax=Brevibacillus choshinensis TaxID=54911 RepID=UPI002E210777|nr:DUF5011 domain-containing protein [Brevibacillus choshinensis]
MIKRRILNVIIVFVSVILLSILLQGCSKADKLSKLGYPEAEIDKISKSTYVGNIISNNLQYNDFRDLKKHEGYKEENLEGYTKVFNKIYTKDEMDMVVIGINALEEKSKDYTEILEKNNEDIRKEIEKALSPKITLKSNELTATSTDKGKDYVKSIITAQSYFDGDITNSAIIEGNFLSNKLGDYQLVVKLKDSKGYQAEQVIKFKLIDNKVPQIKIPSNNNVFQGDNIDLMKDVVGVDNFDGDITKKITIEKNDFSTGKVGTYAVVYKLTDNASNTTTATRELTVKPIIKVNDTFELNKYKITLRSFTYNRTDSEPASYFYNYYTAKEGNTFLITSLRLENLDNIKRRPFEIGGNDEHKINVELIYDGTYTYEASPHGLNNNWYDIFMSIDPLVSMTENLSFEIPISVKDSGKSIVLKFSRYDSSAESFFVKIR